jgi:hypothetical protein
MPRAFAAFMERPTLTQNVPEPEAISIREAVRRSGLSRSFLYSAIEKGLLVSRRIEGRRIILMADLRAFLRGDARDAA